MTVSPFTHKRVKVSERFFLKNIREELNPLKNNGQGRHLEYDIDTNIGSFDAQYYTSSNLQFVDFISVLTPQESVVLPNGKRDHKLFWSQVNSMNKDIKVFQDLGYSLKQILHCLEVYAAKGLKPGKLMNDKYDYVGYVKYKERTCDIENYRVLDLSVLRKVPTNRVTVAFNLKDKWNSLNDLYHSAYVKFTSADIKAADVTDKFIDRRKITYP